MENGLRAISGASLNPDPTKEEQNQRDNTKNINRSKTHISAIQETHIAQDRAYTLDNYRIRTAAATKIDTNGAVQGGVAIITHASTTPYITHIARKI